MQGFTEAKEWMAGAPGTAARGSMGHRQRKGDGLACIKSRAHRQRLGGARARSQLGFPQLTALPAVSPAAVRLLCWESIPDLSNALPLDSESILFIPRIVAERNAV